MFLTVKRAVLKVLAVAAAAGIGVVAGIVPSTAANAAGPAFFDCPYGAVCIYADDRFEHLTSAYITNVYYSYGAHNLVNQFNDHAIVNNQYGGEFATARTCYGYNGTNCTGPWIPPLSVGVVNLTPINSIVLNRP
jgi:hypothetical protein